MPILDIPDWTCHRRKKREREGEGKNAWSSLHLVKRRFRDRENIADDGHCKIRQIRKVHRIITKPNKPNGVKAYSNSLLHAITAHNHLPFFKIFSNFVHICPNFQIFFPFSTFALFLKNHSPFSLLSRIGIGCIYQTLINLMVYLLDSIYFYVVPASKVELKVVRLQSQINIFDTALMF